MKKFIAIMLAVVMFGTFIAGCGSTATGTDTQPAAAPAAAGAEHGARPARPLGGRGSRHAPQPAGF